MLADLFPGIWRQYDSGLILWTPWWHDDEPDGATGSNYAVIGLRTDAYAGRWLDYPCTTAYHYVCER